MSKEEIEISWSSAQRDLRYTLWVIELSHVIEFSTAIFLFGCEEDQIWELLSIDTIEEQIPLADRDKYHIDWPHNYINLEDAKASERLRRKQNRLRVSSYYKV